MHIIWGVRFFSNLADNHSGRGANEQDSDDRVQPVIINKQLVLIKQAKETIQLKQIIFGTYVERGSLIQR